MEKILQWIEGKKLIQAFLSGTIKRDDLTAEQYKFIQETMQRRIRRARKRIEIAAHINMILRNIFVKPVHYPLKPLPVSWHPDFGDGASYPHCPKCDEYAYYKTHCVFCGRRFIWKDEK